MTNSLFFYGVKRFSKKRAREADSSGFQGDRNEKASGVWPSEAFGNRILGKLKKLFQ